MQRQKKTNYFYSTKHNQKGKHKVLRKDIIEELLKIE